MQSTASKILSRAQLIAAVQEWRSKSNKIVFTNGCFDILHLGHVDYLERAKALGDRLVVALNTDASVQKLKGPERPLQSETARARVMAALACVDAVVLFGEETPLELIKSLLPDVLVKGGDYTEENVVGAKEVRANGGEVALISFVDGFSTTSIVEKMRKSE